MSYTALGTRATVLETRGNIRIWRYTLFALSLCVLWILVWYASTARAMVEIWQRSDTFAHGFVVPPIALWLAWRMRAQLATAPPNPAWCILPLIAMTGFVWLLGELAWVNAVTQFALVALIVLTVVGVLGITAARKLAFPLAFLFFAVPLGEFMMPRLMEWTADATVLGLRLSGIPVFREGQRFAIPTATWSVVEACSGVRYLIASTVVGTLYAYLTYRSLKRRLVFVAVAVAVPLVANWVRAYLIVMLGHVSGNQIAAGVDHLIYGWLFFGIVIGLLFWVGTRWREEQISKEGLAQAAPLTRQPASVSKLSMAAVMAGLVAVLWKPAHAFIENSDAAGQPHLPRLLRVPDWEVSEALRGTWQPRFRNPSDEVQQTFRNGEHQVTLVLAYYRRQHSASKLLSAENVLVRISPPGWTQVASTSREAVIDGRPVRIRATESRGEGDQRVSVWHWYWIGGYVTANDYVARAYLALRQLQLRGDDAASVLVYAAGDEKELREQALKRFLKSAAPAIDTLLTETREQR